MMRNSGSRIIAIDASISDIGSVISIVGALPANLFTPILIQLREKDVSRPEFETICEHLVAAGCRGLRLAEPGETIGADGIWLSGCILGTSLNPDGHSWQKRNDQAPWEVSELFAQVASAFGPEAIGVVLFRYGQSERAAVLAIGHAGGTTIAQCSEKRPRGPLVWHDAPDYILPDADIVLLLERLVARKIPNKLKRPAPSPIIVMGASTGGVDAFQKIAAELSADFAPPIFMLLHRRRLGSVGQIDMLQRMIAGATSKVVRIANDGDEIEGGTIYLPRDDKHMLIRNDRITFIEGLDDGEWRPSINALFNSAAECYGPRTVGLLLTGMLDDGVLGLNRITEYGGITIAQAPEDAVAPSMPINAIRHDHPNYVLPLHQIVQLLEEITSYPFPRGVGNDSVALSAAMTAARKQNKEDDTK